MRFNSDETSVAPSASPEVPTDSPGGVRPSWLITRRQQAIVPVASILVLALLYAALAASFGRIHSFYSPDCGARWWMVRYAGPHGDVTRLRNDNRDVDPNGLLHPLTLLTTKNLINGYVATTPRGPAVQFPPLFPFVSRLLYLRFGRGALTLLPVASGLAALTVVWIIGRRLQLRSSMFLPAALGLATPLLLYSVLFWDHSIQILLSAIAALFLARACEEDRPELAIPAGCVLGLGILFHELFFALFVGILCGGIFVAARHPRSRRFAIRASVAATAGFVPWLICWLISNQALYGNPRGAHLTIAANYAASGALAAAERPARIAGRFVNAFTGVEVFGTPFARRALPLFGFCLVVALTASRFGRRARWLCAIAWIAAACICAYWCGSTQSAEGLFEATPILIPALALPVRRERPGPAAGSALSGRGAFYSWIGIACIVFFLLVIVNPQAPGLWGQRYLLTALPFLALLAARAIDTAWEGARSQRVLVALGAVALLCASLWSEALGLKMVRQRCEHFAELSDVVAQTAGPAIATDHWFLFAQMTDPPAARMFQLYAGDRQPMRIPQFYDALDALHIDRFAFFGRPLGLRLLAAQGARRASPFVPRFRVSSSVLTENDLVEFLFERQIGQPAP
jgi:hypothetical protein